MLIKFKNGSYRLIYCITEVSFFNLRDFHFAEYTKETNIMHLPVNWKIDICSSEIIKAKEITKEMVEKKMEVDISLPGSDVKAISDLQTCGVRIEAGEKYGHHKYLSFVLLNKEKEGIAQLYTDILLDSLPQGKTSLQ